MKHDNPLHAITDKLPFDKLRADHIEPGVEAALEEARLLEQRLSNSSEKRTFENTMLALERIPEKVAFIYTILDHVNSVNNSDDFRDAFEKVQAPISEFLSGISRSAGLWKAVSEYAATDEARSLTGAKKRYLDVTIRDFKKAGAALEPEKRARLTEIEVELAKLTLQFGQNVLDATNDYELVISDPADLAGLPARAVGQAAESARAKSVEGWRFTLQAPSFVPLMTYLDNRKIREEVYKAFNGRAASGERDNSKLIARILSLRKELAELHGFKNFADYILQDRMAKDGDSAVAFISSLKGRITSGFQKEAEELQKFRDQSEKEKSSPLLPWDLSYYAEKMRKELYEFDDEDLRPYFSYEKVLSGLFELARRLYGLSINEVAGFPVWDNAVKTYQVADGDGTILGTFYTDFFPRETKRGGAWMNCFISGYAEESRFNPHHGFIAGNFTPAIGDKPALLTHSEVETTFHEFGHLLHQLLSRVEIKSLSGLNVAWDFVELPSQIMENWCWEREALDIFAEHYISGEKIPQQLFDRMMRAKNFRSASQFMRQLSLAGLDLALHTYYDPATHGEVLKFARNFMQEHSAAPLYEGYAMIASFTHIFSSTVGYAAGYYSYKWAEVLDADAFTRFQSEGIFNLETAASFRSSILAPGNSSEAAALYREFMGRDPDPEALLKRSNII